MISSLAHLRIILVEPAGALNVGSIARVMKNMGLQQLVLVNPQCDPLGVEARQMAVHAADLLESAQKVATLPEALTGCVKAIATTGKWDITLPLPLESPQVALPWLLPPSTPLSPCPPAALIFGREDNGLSLTELNYAHRLIFIPTDAVYTSLNLAQAVAICCYELRSHELRSDELRSDELRSDELRSAQLETDNLPASAIASSHALPPPMPAFPLPPAAAPLASLDMLERYYQDLEALLLKICFLYPHTAVSRMSKLRRLFNRAALSESELAMLRGILRQMQWALQQASSGQPEKISEVEDFRPDNL